MPSEEFNMRVINLKKLLLYIWVSPITLLFLPLLGVAKLSGGKVTVHSGVIEICDGWLGQQLASGLPWFGAVNAFTVGHIVVGISAPHLASSRCHERVHVAQFEKWGCVFPLVYGLGSLYALARGKHAYWDNPYECEARAKAAQQSLRN
jgi:hypothetical protein